MPHSKPFPATVRTRDGLQLHAQTWPLPPGAGARGVAILVHGLGEHVGRYAHVAALLNELGWHVVGCDHRGHGRSPGPRGVLQHSEDLLFDLATVLDTARAAWPSLPHMLVGHSLGGAVAARFAAALAQPPETVSWSRPLEALVLSSPALAIPISLVQRALLGSVGVLTPDVAVSNGLKAEWLSHDPAVVAAYKTDPLVHDRVTGRITKFMMRAGATALARAPNWTVPTFLTWGGQDRCVKPEGSAEFAEKAPEGLVQEAYFPQMGHEVFNEVEQTEVLNALRNWLLDRFGG